MRNLELLLWDEMSTEELEAYRAHWIRDYMNEIGCDELVAEIRFEDYVGQGGYTLHDEYVAMRRDRIFEQFPVNKVKKPIDVVVVEDEGPLVFVEHYGQGDVHYGLFKPNGEFYRNVEYPAYFLKSVAGEEKARSFVGRVPGDWGYKEISRGEFDTSSLKGDGLKAANAILEVMRKHGELYAGGCKCFYSAEEWEARGEPHGDGGVLVVCHDGGTQVRFFSWDYQCYDLIEEIRVALEPLGMYAEQGTSWHSTIYKVSP